MAAMLVLVGSAAADSPTIPNQETFFAGKDGAIHAEYVDASDAWQDFSIPGTSPSAGTSVSALDDPTTGRNVFYRGVNGALHDTWVNNGAWADLSIPGTDPAPGSQIAAIDDVTTGRNIFYEDANGALHDAWVQGGAWMDFAIPGAILMPHSGISVIDDFGAGRQIFVEGLDGGLYDIWVNNGVWTTTEIPNTHLAANSAISAEVDPVTGRNIFYEGANDELEDAWVSGSTWTVSTLTTTPMAPATAISALWDPATGRNVFFEGAGGSIHDAWVNSLGWQDTTLPGVLANDSSISAMDDPATGRNVFVEGVGDNGMYDIFVNPSSGGWSDFDLTASLPDGSPIEALNLTAYTNAPTDTPTTEPGTSLYTMTGSNGTPQQVSPSSNLAPLPNETGTAGDTHCFFSLSNGGPHAGCQVNRSYSVKIVNAAIAGGTGTLGGLVCAVAAVSWAPWACATLGAVVGSIIDSYISPLSSGQCIEIGEYPLHLKYYVKKLACTAE